MPDLSPAAQAVLDAVVFSKPGLYSGIAAGLRAAADQVAPENYECFTGHMEWDQGMEARNDSVRENLLALAAELESLNE